MIIGQVAIELPEFNLHLSRHVSDRLLGRHIAMHRDGLAAGGFHQVYRLGAVDEDRPPQCAHRPRRAAVAKPLTLQRQSKV
jgi:hypothetical protein